MAGPVEDKGSLTERLDDDRQKMAVQVSELKEDYNVPRRLRGSVQKYPWSWIMGAVLVGFLFSRLPARRKEVYLWADPLSGKPSGEVHLRPAGKDESRPTQKIWSLIKPLISAYVGREVYNRVKGPTKRRRQRRNYHDRTTKQ
jgi:hypothetical protein